MTQVTPFDFENQRVRAIHRDGEPWFVASDVCRCLNIKQTTRAVEYLDDDEKGVSSTHTLGGLQEVIIVNESGLYTLILRSRKATTPGTVQHRFRRWVTSEVLPAIRQAGRYDMQAGHPLLVSDQDHRYTVREAIVRPDGQWGRVWAIPVYQIDGLDFWNVHVVMEAYCGLPHVPDEVNLHENARDLMELHPELIGASPLWVARPDGLATIIRLAGGCWDSRASGFMHQLTQAQVCPDRNFSVRHG